MLNVCGSGEASNGNFHITVNVVKLKQSFLILITDQEEFGIGTVTLSAPPLIEGTNASSSPFPLFGLKNNMLANLIGKVSSQKLNAPALSLVYILEQNLKMEEIMKTTMDAVMSAIKDVLEKQNKK
jgi:hypothetical protein